MEHNIYLKINGELFTLSLDSETFNHLTSNPNELLPEYINNLKENKMIDVDIQELQCSLDNVNFNEINGNNASEESQSADSEAWGENATRLLLDKYEMYLPLVGPMRKFKKKKNLWSAISEDLSVILNIRQTPQQCENRYKTTKSPQTNPYEQEISKIAAIDDNIEPPVKIGVGQRIVKATDTTHSADSSPSTSSCSSRSATPTFSRKRPLNDVLLTIAREKEEGHNRRHKEKLEFLKVFAEKLLKKSNNETE